MNRGAAHNQIEREGERNVRRTALAWIMQKNKACSSEASG